MKILESTPHRYDRGIRLLTLGRIDKSYDRIVEFIKNDDSVLEIGCGTGMLTIRAAQKSTKIVGIDINPQMIEIANTRLQEAHLDESVDLIEMGVAELDEFEEQKFNVILSGLCFSELSSDEIDFTLKESYRLLSSGGYLILADETKSSNIFKRSLNFVIRLPLVIITWILTQTTTKAIVNLDNRIIEAGFTIISFNTNWLENFTEIVAKKEK